MTAPRETPDDHTSQQGTFDRWRQVIGLVLGPLVAFALLLLPLGDLDPAAHRLAAIAALVLIFWVSEALPLPVTALLGVTLIVLLGVAPAEDTLSAFGNQVIFLFIGSFMLAAAMRRHELDRRIAYALLSHPWVGGSSYRTIWALGLTAWALSMWISNTASVAMLFPVALAISQSMSTVMRQNGEPVTAALERRHTTGLLLMLAYSGSVGGIATPVGTPPNLIGIALIEAETDTRIRFLEWMTFALPLSTLLLGVVFGIILLFFRPAVRDLPDQPSRIRAQREALGPWTAGQRNSLIAFAVAVALWIAPGLFGIVLGAGHELTVLLENRLPEGIVALLAAVLLFVLPADWSSRTFTLTWDDAVRIDWGIILLFGGGIALGTALFDTGLAERIGSGVLTAFGVESRFALSGLGALVAALVSETSSNTASVNIVLPVLLAATDLTGAAEIVVAVATILGASMGFMLPVSTPPNAIVYGSGQVRLTDMIRAGFMLDIVGVLVIWLASLWFLPSVIGFFHGP
jgi:solute carrier family 13 (sodium-dependent dicarboxylate transporter), member 2/3/5